MHLIMSTLVLLAIILGGAIVDASSDERRPHNPDDKLSLNNRVMSRKSRQQKVPSSSFPSTRRSSTSSLSPLLLSSLDAKNRVASAPNLPRRRFPLPASDPPTEDKNSSNATDTVNSDIASKVTKRKRSTTSGLRPQAAIIPRLITVVTKPIRHVIDKDNWLQVLQEEHDRISRRLKIRTSWLATEPEEEIVWRCLLDGMSEALAAYKDNDGKKRIDRHIRYGLEMLTFIMDRSPNDPSKDSLDDALLAALVGLRQPTSREQVKVTGILLHRLLFNNQTGKAMRRDRIVGVCLHGALMFLTLQLTTGDNIMSDDRQQLLSESVGVVLQVVIECSLLAPSEYRLSLQYLLELDTLPTFHRPYARLLVRLQDPWFADWLANNAFSSRSLGMGPEYDDRKRRLAKCQMAVVRFYIVKWHRFPVEKLPTLIYRVYTKRQVIDPQGFLTHELYSYAYERQLRAIIRFYPSQSAVQTAPIVKPKHRDVYKQAYSLSGHVNLSHGRKRHLVALLWRCSVLWHLAADRRTLARKLDELHAGDRTNWLRRMQSFPRVVQPSMQPNALSPSKYRKLSKTNPTAKATATNLRSEDDAGTVKVAIRKDNDSNSNEGNHDEGGEHVKEEDAEDDKFAARSLNALSKLELKSFEDDDEDKDMPPDYFF
jgi:hypothetical protein